MHPDEPTAELLTTMSEISMPSLNVSVDFNALMDDHGLTEALDIIGKLKDLLR